MRIGATLFLSDNHPLKVPLWMKFLLSFEIDWILLGTIGNIKKPPRLVDGFVVPRERLELSQT